MSSFKCYVCAPEEGKPEDMYTLRKSFPTHDIQSCSAYAKSRRHLYLLECPHGGSNGCLTKFEGKCESLNDVCLLGPIIATILIALCFQQMALS